MTPPEQAMARSCRVCHEPVTPWRRGWRRPTVTIHEGCQTAICQLCGLRFHVGKERQGLFCCVAHLRVSQSMAADQRAAQAWSLQDQARATFERRW